MKKIDKLALLLLIVAGLNWGLWGFWDFNVVSFVFGREWIDQLFYFAFGASALYLAYRWKKKMLS
ncbi:MAG: DUF378 domain-containing protein [Parachlamydiales bacterium]|jgi:hypothetical protein